MGEAQRHPRRATRSRVECGETHVPLVLGAGDGPEALRILASARPDLLVTDGGLPNGMDGRQGRQASARTRCTPTGGCQQPAA